jgi:RNAse (barnase) inhibitor barstar
LWSKNIADWQNIFGSYLNSGVYGAGKLRSIRVVKTASIDNRLDYTHIDLKQATDKESFLKLVASALHFPDYFGMNWDALNDCLTDLSWKPAEGYVILFTNFQTITENMASEMAIIRSIFDSSASYWKQKKVPFFIILSD